MNNPTDGNGNLSGRCTNADGLTIDRMFVERGVSGFIHPAPLWCINQGDRQIFSVREICFSSNYVESSSIAICDRATRIYQMKKSAIFGSILIIGFSASAFAETSVAVGGMAMYPSKNIVQNAVNSTDHTTLVAAVKAAGLVPTLEGNGPFTVFAPTNAAFAALPTGTVDTLLKPENKALLTKVLTYHVVPGIHDSSAIRAAILAGKGKATMKTVEGETLTFMMNGANNIMVHDGKGSAADIIVYDVMQSNGVIFSVDKVLMPAS